MSELWTVGNNHTLGTYQESLTQTIALPIQNADSVSLISGEIPGGLRLDGFNLVGTPYEVKTLKTFSFVLRAKKGNFIDDRNIKIIIDGADAPTWVTNEGGLPLGPNNKFYILDSSRVDFQLQVIDPDLPAGDEITYFMKDDSGDLPPGITLTSDGRLVGIVEPILALEKRAGTGYFDTNTYGEYPFDFGLKSFNGYESFYYDTTFYDYAVATTSPKKLNRYYEFTVSASDGITITDRQFQVYLVGDDYLRADNTVMQIATGLFTADNTYIRTPIWLTPGDLGYRRANNYVVIYLDVYDPTSSQGIITYSLQSTNADGSASILPPGLALDLSNGEIAGFTPYQPAVTKEYKFTVRANRQSGTEDVVFKDKEFTVKLLGEVESVITWNTASALGNLRANLVSTLFVSATSTVTDAVLIYSLESGSLPPGLTLTVDGQISGKIRQFGSTAAPGLTTIDKATTVMTFDGGTTTIDRSYTFKVKAQDQFGFSAIEKEFVLTTTDPDDTLYSNISISPLLKQSQRTAFRNFISNPAVFLPESIYRPNDPTFGLQSEVKILAYAGIETKAINQYIAAISRNHKRKKLKIGAVKKALAINPGTTDTVYEIVYIDVFDPYEPATGKTKKSVEINTKNKITADQIQFETQDDNTGVGTGNAGFTIELRGGAVFSPASSGDITIFTRSGPVIFSVGSNITLELQDGSDIIVANIDNSINADPLRLRPLGDTLKIDSNAIKVSEKLDNKRYISNITNMRDQIATVGENLQDFLPLWMRTSQTVGQPQLGYTLAIPLCYCKPGTADQIILNITNNAFDFSTIDLEIDRYIIDSTDGNSENQYLAFNNYQYNV